MGGKIKKLWDKVSYFCATQALTFYCGMGLGILSLIVLCSFLTPLISAICTPLLSSILFTIFVYVNKGKFSDAFYANLLGTLYVLLFLI